MKVDAGITRRKALKLAGISGAVNAGGSGVAAANSGGHQSENRKINELRQATAKYHDVAEAEENGYALDPHCVSHPELDAMGYQYTKFSDIDESGDPTGPEALVYERRGERFNLVAVEFLANGDDLPLLFGHEFQEFPAPLAD